MNPATELSINREEVLSNIFWCLQHDNISFVHEISNKWGLGATFLDGTTSASFLITREEFQDNPELIYKYYYLFTIRKADGEGKIQIGLNEEYLVKMIEKELIPGLLKLLVQEKFPKLQRSKEFQKRLRAMRL